MIYTHSLKIAFFHAKPLKLGFINCLHLSKKLGMNSV